MQADLGRPRPDPAPTRPIRFTALVGFGVAALAYLLPFIAITAVNTISGIDLVRNSFLMASTLSVELSRHGRPFLNTFLLTFGTFTVALLLAVIGLVFNLIRWRRSPLVGLMCGALASTVLVTGFLYWRQYLPFGIGIYIAIIALLIATAVSAAGVLQVAKSSRVNS